MILDAQDWADKLVNGSLGEWCPHFSDALEKLWKHIAFEAQQPSDSDAVKLLEKIKRDSWKELEDYGYADLGFIIDQLEKQVKKQTPSKEEKVVFDLTADD